MKLLFTQVDNAVKRVAAQFPKEFKCKKGCSDCCNAAFDVSLAEGYLIKKRFAILGRKTRKQILKKAKKAQKIWDANVKGDMEVISKLRIPCPLLSRDEECLLYEVRPVNCRTYGVPTEINGMGHVCSLSGFEPGKSYPTIRLQVIQQELLKISRKIDPKHAEKRQPISAILLDNSNSN